MDIVLTDVGCTSWYQMVPPDLWVCHSQDPNVALGDTGQWSRLQDLLAILEVQKGCVKDTAFTLGTSKNRYKSWVRMSDVPLPCCFFLSVWKRTSENLGSLWEPGQVYHQARVAGQSDEEQTRRRDSKAPWLQQRPPRYITHVFPALNTLDPCSWQSNFRSRLC